MNFLPDTASRVIFSLYIIWGYFIFSHLINRNIVKFWCWLKGSRKTYYLGQDGNMVCSPRKLRTPIDRVGTDMNPNNQGVIEIGNGLFRRSSRIYGDYHIANWEIAGHLKSAAGFFVCLNGTHVLPPESALRLINTYPSPHAMLDRIAKLEKDLGYVNKRRAELRAIPHALLQIIKVDRQKFRSQAVQHIREFLEQIEVQATMMGESSPTEEQVEAWKQLSAHIIEGH